MMTNGKTQGHACQSSEAQVGDDIGMEMNKEGETEPPRKYRIKKRHWQPDQDDLDEVIKQELSAWRDIPTTNQRTIRRTPRSPTSLRNRESRNPANNEFDFEADMRQSDQYHYGSMPIDISLRQPPTTPLIRKSCFLEGSMNEASRGIASTWIGAESMTAVPSQSDSAVSESESGASTPQNRPSSRMSLSSSIDINEFKPLPPTPTTFKATMKRIGHRIKTGDFVPHQEKDNFNATMRATRTPGRGLRRSMSTWRFFDSNASEADDEGAPSITRTDHKIVRNSASSKTLRLLGRHKKQPDLARTDNILDERKRKAEIAYAEQFGGTQKKQKQGPLPQSHAEDTGDEPQPVTMRRRTSVPRPGLTQQRRSSYANIEELPLPLLPSHPVLHISDQQGLHRRTPSRESTSTVESDRDRRKRASRSELEKENQYLRDLLRQNSRRTRSWQAEQEVHLREKPDLGEDASSRHLATTRSAEQPSRCGALSSHPVESDDIHPDKVPSIPASVNGKAAEATDDIPPVLVLPPSAAGRGVLVPTSNSAVSYRDTATVKRRAPRALMGRNIELPRPLSMVLEGMEDDSNQRDVNDNAEAIPLEHVRKGQHNASQRGLDSPDVEHFKENWQWPEDVF